MRKLLIALAVLAVLFVAADRIAVAAAENQVSSRIASAYSLSARPAVTISGFPFLTQVAAGDYQRIGVAVGTVRADGYTLTRLRASFTGVRASLSQVLSGRGAAVTASHATGSGLIAYAQVRSHLPAKVSLAPAGRRLKVSGDVRFHGLRVPVSALLALSVTRAGIVVKPVNVTTPLGFSVPAGAVAGTLSFVIGVHTLPMHLRLTSVAVTPGGLRISAAATGVRLTQP